MNSSDYFSESELSCNCGECDGWMDEEFLERLDDLREMYGRAMVLSSAYRCNEYNFVVGGTQHSPHTKGIAVDVVVAGVNAYDLVSYAMKMGFSGIGIKQEGNWSGRFIHLDDAKGDTRPRIWSY